MTGTTYTMRVSGLNTIQKRAASFGNEAIEKIKGIIAKNTLLAKAEISNYITALRLVDTGFYKENWIADVSVPFRGKLSTTTEYALMLEFGYHGPQTVKQHTRKAHSRRSKSGKTYTVKAHTVSSHTRKVNRKGYGAGQHTVQVTKNRLRNDFQKLIKELRAGR